MSLAQDLLHHPNATRTTPASPESLEALATEAGAPLPAQLLDIWRTTDGLRFPTIDAHIPTVAEVRALIATDTWGRAFFQWVGLIPIFDNHCSNYLTFAVKGPLAGRVVYTPHDDSPRLMFHDLDACLRAIVKWASARRTADYILHDELGDYAPTTPRSDADRHAGRAILDTTPESELWNFAISLLGEDDIDAWVRLLETNHWIRRDALARLHKLKTPAVAALLHEDQERYREFTNRFIAAAREAGLDVGERQGISIRINGKGYMLDGFFNRRHIPAAMPRAIAWITDQLAGRDPRKRPYNFMTDDAPNQLQTEGGS